jgi:hypothetical protein
MDQSRFPAWTRRRFLARSAGLAVSATFVPAGSGFLHGGWSASAAGTAARDALTHGPLAPSTPLIEQVITVCDRLAPEGWRDLLLAVSHDELDIAAADLRTMLAQPLSQIDRTIPGFEDFALEGTRGIEPGSPARSLLFHALASPNVFGDAAGNDLSAFPTPAEIEAVENYVYGVTPPSLDDLQAQADDHPLAVVVFALEYRTARETVHGKHADFCFARTGLARMGTTEAIYDARRRDFLPGKADDPFAFPVQPVRYAPFLAVQRPSDPDTFGPLRATDDDRSRLFWVPLHKLFSGPECLQGFDLTVTLATEHRNEKLRRFHTRMNTAGFYTGWDAPDIDQFPFVIQGETLAAFSTDPDHGSGWVVPPPHPLVEPATHDGQPLTFYYSQELAASPEITYASSLQPLEAPPFQPLGPGRTQSLPENINIAEEEIPGYLTEISPDNARSSPEYLNIRHTVSPDGTEENLNDLPDIFAPINEGGYWAQHFIDHAGDGWVAARCRELDAMVPARVPAYSTVAPPSFYPYTSQRALTEWAESGAPEELRHGIWAIPPRPLSDRRLAANINLAAGFSIDDDTVTALVSLPLDAGTTQSGAPGTFVRRHLHLPDGMAGLFDPGWDVSQDRTADNRFFLANHGLGTPFVEDAKLCAAPSTYWPGVSPDSAREFQPAIPSGENQYQVWPTIAPMTDEELGIVEVEGLGFLPWDGVRGPHVTVVDGKEVVDYPEFAHTDYLETVKHFTAALTGKVDQEEYIARVLAMAQVYWALGIRWAEFGEQYGIAEALDRFQAAKAEWTVLSFRALGEGTDDERTEAETAAGVRLQGDTRYRFHLFQWNGVETPSEDVRRILVGIKNQVVAYTDLTNILLNQNETWEHHLPPR